MGASVRGDVARINERRREQGYHPVSCTAFRGSDAVENPEAIVERRLQVQHGRYGQGAFGNGDQVFHEYWPVT